MSEQLLPKPEHTKPAFTPEAISKPRSISAEKIPPAQERIATIESSYEQAITEAKKAEELVPRQEQESTTPREGTGMGRKQAYISTLQHLAREQSTPERIFSRFVHNRIIESISENTSHTIARPHPLLWAGVGACLTLGFFYLIAQRYGYQMSGFEGIAGLLGGYLLGFIIDLLRRR